MFCQVKETSKLRSVMTMNLSDKILQLAKSDLYMRVRLAGIADLIAAEGKYHPQCLVEFERKMKKKAEGGNTVDNNLDRICCELLDGLALGNVYDMGHVWNRYQALCEENHDIVPDSYISRRKSFYDSLQRCIGDQASFVRPLDKN